MINKTMTRKKQIMRIETELMMGVVGVNCARKLNILMQEA